MPASFPVESSRRRRGTFNMYVRTGERHGYSQADATHPENQFAFTVSPLPVRDWADTALKAAQDAYFAEWPEERKRASSLLWRIEKVGGYEDPNLSVALGAHSMSAQAVADAAMKALRRDTRGA
jgi:hypothetical protein